MKVRSKPSKAARHARRTYPKKPSGELAFGGGAMPALLALALLLAALAIAFAMPGSAAAGSDEGVNDSELADVPEQIHGSSDCDHAWVARVEKIAHAEATHEVKHDAVYKDSLVGHTVCNECGAVIDGAAAQHLKDTGHAGYTTQVPVIESTLVSEGWVETVVDEPAWEETVQTGAECVLCGEKRPA